VIIPRVDVASLPVEAPGSNDRVRSSAAVFAYSALQGRLARRRRRLLYAKDLVFDTEASALPDLQSLRRDALFVPESQGLVDRFATDAGRRTRRSRSWSTSTGATSGIVTMEDVLEESVGRDRDELDEDAARIEKRGQGGTSDGRVNARRACIAGVEVEEGERSGSIGAALMVRLKRSPAWAER